MTAPTSGSQSSGRVRIQEELLRSGASGKERRSTESGSATEDAVKVSRGNQGSPPPTSRGIGRGGRRRIQDEILSPPPQSETPPPTETAPTQESAPASDQASAIDSLARKYVAQYEKNAGRSLTSSEREQRVQDVADFYSDPSRAGRLDKVVF